MGAIDFIYIIGGIGAGWLWTAGYGAVSVTPPDFKLARKCFAASALLAGGLTVMWGLTTNAHPIVRIVLAAVVGGLTLVVLSEGLRWLRDREFGPSLAEPRLNIEVRSALVSDTGPRTLFMVRYGSSYGDTVSPIFYLAYVQITNPLDYPIGINDIKIDASKNHTGPWEELRPISLRSGTVVRLGPPKSVPVPTGVGLANGTLRLAGIPSEDTMKTASITGMAPFLLEIELTKQIQPHSSIWGWIALDSLHHAGLAPGQIFFRVKIRDSVNKTDGLYVVELPRKQPGDSSLDLNCGMIIDTGTTMDVSKSRLKYYSDPFLATP